MPARKKNSRLGAYLLLIINTITWGAALIIVKPAFAVTTPFRFLLYRYILATFLSIPLLIYYWPKVNPDSKLSGKLKAIKVITLIELIGTTAALAFLYLGLARTSAIEASLLANTTPIFVVLAGVIFLKEKEEKNEALGLALAFLGTVLLTLEPVIYNGGLLHNFSLSGNLLIIAQNIATAFYFILAKKHYRKLPKLFTSTISFYVGLVTFFILSLIESQSLGSLGLSIMSDINSNAVWIASGYMALFGSIIGLTAYIKAQDQIEASEATLFYYLQPLVYLPMGILLLKEKVDLVQIVALAIILTGVVIAEARRKGKTKRRVSAKRRNK